MVSNRSVLFVLAGFLTQAIAIPRKVVLTNDDGWAVAQIRAEFVALREAGFDVVLSSPAENESGTGSSTAAATRLNITCEFDTCPIGATAEGFEPFDRNVDAVRFGIQTRAPELLGSKPDFVISGSNIGNNLGPVVLISGTVGAATEAALEGIPSIAFSGGSGAQISFETLSNASLPSTQSAEIYTSLVVSFTEVLLDNPPPILNPGISLNVNFASISSTCNSPQEFSFVLTRINPDPSVTDVSVCGTDHLPAEADAILEGCIATVSVFNASTKADVDAAQQEAVLKKLTHILTCLPSS
ncbi:survival protein sure-like phosphatase/nucleotidase [Pluteus cervinus]|uniref:Survival protein sure-like phosphatase/nucleotidase n=1 Tax=Pluteus cervinus TaxID=181527 RepID=A0ACD3AR15_9AGAR|nr:survival protein sure-like phosphatase/nucleotidase [Pluteus cervinus]